jgi:hypothetical protein
VRERKSGMQRKIAKWFSKNAEVAFDTTLKGRMGVCCWLLRTTFPRGFYPTVLGCSVHYKYMVERVRCGEFKIPFPFCTAIMRLKFNK